MMDDFTRNSPFALVFVGDGGPAAFLARNWDALLARLKSQLWDGGGQPPCWDEMVDDMSDPDAWDTDDFGPWHYTTDLGEGRMTVYRLTQD